MTQHHFAGRPLTFASLGGYPVLLLLFSYVMQGMLFWGVTLWIPLAVKSVGFSGWSQAFASSLPYLMAVLLAWPISRISDRTGKRVLIASLGLLIPGVLLMLLPTVDSGYAKLALITLALGYYASSYSPNIWSILQSTIAPESIGAASGIINGIGAGGGGTLAGLMVGALYRSTGSYMPGFVTLGALVLLGGVALLWYGRLAGARYATAHGTRSHTLCAHELDRRGVFPIGMVGTGRGNANAQRGVVSSPIKFAASFPAFSQGYACLVAAIPSQTYR